MAPAGSLSGIKILVVDDPTIAELMIDQIHKEGCQRAGSKIDGSMYHRSGVLNSSINIGGSEFRIYLA